MSDDALNIGESDQADALLRNLLEANGLEALGRTALDPDWIATHTAADLIDSLATMAAAAASDGSLPAIAAAPDGILPGRRPESGQGRHAMRGEAGRILRREDVAGASCRACSYVREFSEFVIRWRNA